MMEGWTGVKERKAHRQPDKQMNKWNKHIEKRVIVRMTVGLKDIHIDGNTD
jgi:hypothetical protein